MIWWILLAVYVAGVPTAAFILGVLDGDDNAEEMMGPILIWPVVLFAWLVFFAPAALGARIRSKLARGA